MVLALAARSTTATPAGERTRCSAARRSWCSTACSRGSSLSSDEEPGVGGPEVGAEHDPHRRVEEIDMAERGLAG
jgi:hypothetical protein